MKNVLLLILNIYQRIFSSLIKNLLGVSAICRYSPTCSEYAKKSIGSYGAFRGSYLSIIRVLSCNSFSVQSNNL